MSQTEYSVIGCVHVIKMSFFLIYLKVVTESGNPSNCKWLPSFKNG